MRSSGSGVEERGPRHREYAPAPRRARAEQRLGMGGPGLEQDGRVEPQEGIVMMLVERTMTVAVLPFVNLTEDPRIGEIGEAIGASLRTLLGGTNGVRAARTSLATPEHDDFHIAHLGRALHADALLLGWVGEEDGLLRGKAQLVEAKTGETQWSTELGWDGEVVSAERIAALLERDLRLWQGRQLRDECAE